MATKRPVESSTTQTAAINESLEYLYRYVYLFAGKENKMIVEKIKRELHTGTVIPKPRAERTYTFEGTEWRDGEEFIVFYIHNSHHLNRATKTVVPASLFARAYEQLLKAGFLSHEWSREHIPELHTPYHFTTVGGVFVRLNIAVHESGRGYRKVE